MILVVLMALAGTAAALVIRRRRPHGLDFLQRNLLATNISYFATLYTFFLSFAVITLWNNYTMASEDLAHEAYSATTLARTARLLPGPRPFQEAMAGYLESVARDEWPAMAQGERSPKTRARYEEVWRAWESLRTEDVRQTIYHARMLEDMEQLSHMRHARLESVRGTLLWPFWLLIHLGFAFTVVALFYTELGHGLADTWYMGMMLLMVIVIVWLIRELDSPFNGVLRLSPERFLEAAEQVRELMGR
jgi:hypothetical protein